MRKQETYYCFGTGWFVQLNSVSSGTTKKFVRLKAHLTNLRGEFDKY